MKHQAQISQEMQNDSMMRRRSRLKLHQLHRSLSRFRVSYCQARFMLRMHGMVQWYEVDHDLRVSLVADDDAVVAAVAARRLFYVLCRGPSDTASWPFCLAIKIENAVLV